MMLNLRARLGIAWTLGVAIALGTLAVGCTPAPRPIGEWRGPSERIGIQRAPWTYTRATGATHKGEVLTSPHYRLYSTAANAEARESLIQLLEAAHIEYRKLAPTAPATTSPMECYVFGDRAQWMDFTRKRTGADARLYLQITRGGYALRDFFVAYMTADQDTWSVTAHEGFHQFCARHFVGRLPPFLEEGLACTFERVRWEGTGTSRVPRLNPQVNPQRTQSLRTVIEARAAWPLAELITLHAGRVVGAPGTRIEAFYSQSWAFARFVQEYDNGKYRERFARWVAETASGEMFDPTGTHRRNQQYWDPNAVRPIIEHYLGTDLPTLQKEFDEWCRYIAYEEFARQWASQ